MKQQGEKINYIFLWRQNDWGLFKRRNEALLLELSRRDSVESVLHVETLTPKGIMGLVVRWWQARDDSVRRIYRLHFKKAFSLMPISADKEKGIYVYSIFILQFNGIRIPKKLKDFLVGFLKNTTKENSTSISDFLNLGISKRLNSFLIKLQGNVINRKFVQSKKNIVLVVYPPVRYMPEIINTIKYDVLIADLVDDVIARTRNTNVKKEYIEICKDILPRCKWVFSTSPALEEYRDYAGQEIEYLPNGVDSPEFSVNISNKYFENQHRKTAGYVGNINQLVDLDLLEYCLINCPQVDFILIGRIDRETTTRVKKILNQYKNCRYLGERRFTEIPGYLSSFDVLISFKKDDYSTRGNESMKIYQYLLSGKPIVSLPLSPAGRFNGLIYVASDKLQFAEYLKKALDEDNPVVRDKRIHAALENTWTKRADVVHNRVLQHFGISTSNTGN